MKYGPNTAAIENLIDQAKAMTPEQAETIRLAQYASPGTAARVAARATAWEAVRYTARDAARHAAWDHAARHAAWDAARGAARGAARDAAIALVTRDLISEEHFRVLYGPWGSVFGDPK